MTTSFVYALYLPIFVIILLHEVHAELVIMKCACCQQIFTFSSQSHLLVVKLIVPVYSTFCPHEGKIIKTMKVTGREILKKKKKKLTVH